MKKKTFKKTANKVVSVMLATILTFSGFFGVLPTSVFAAENNTVNTFAYNSATHDVTISGATIAASIESARNEAIQGKKWYQQSAINTAFNAAKTQAEKIGTTTVSGFSSTLNIINLAGKLAGFSMTLTGGDNVNAGTYEVKLNISYGGATYVSTLASYTIAPLPLTITADNKDIQEGTQIPENFFTYNVSGSLVGEDALVSGVPSITAVNYTVNSQEGETFAIEASQGTLVVGNTNYTLAGASYIGATLTVIDKLTKKETITLQNNNIIYNAKDNTDAAIASFIESTKASLTAETAVLAKYIKAENVQVSATEYKEIGNYTLSLTIEGEEKIGDFTKFSYTFNQNVIIGQVQDVQIIVNSQMGEIVNTFDVYTKSEVATKVGLEQLGFYVVVPDGTSKEAMNEIKNSGLAIKEVTQAFNTISSTLTVDPAPISSKFAATVTDGTLVKMQFVTDIVDGISASITNSITDILPIPFNLGTYSKTYNGKPLADIEGEELTEFANTTLEEAIKALNEVKGAVNNSGIQMPSDLQISSLPSSLDLGSLSVNLENTFIGEINGVISEINAVLDSVNNGTTGIDSVDALFDVLEGLGTPSVAFVVETTNGGLSGTVNAGESTTVILSLNVTFSLNLNSLLEMGGTSLEDMLGSFVVGMLGDVIDDILNITIMVPVSLPIADITLGVDKLPITIFQKEITGTTIDYNKNGGAYLPLDPQILQAQLFSDHYVVVDTLNYLLLSDTVKTELSQDVLQSYSNTTLGANYEVSYDNMVNDKYYGEIAKEILGAVEDVEGEVLDILNELAQLEAEMDAMQDKASEEYKKLVDRYNELYNKINEKINDIEDKKAELETKINSAIDALGKVIGTVSGVIDGIDLGEVEETLNKYADEAFNALKSQLKIKAEQLAKKIIEQAYEELQKLAMDEQVKEFTDFIEQELKAALLALDAEFPIEANLGTAEKLFNNKEFSVAETGIVEEILVTTKDYKDAVNAISITALSDIVLSELILSFIPEDVQKTYITIVTILEKMGVDVSEYEMSVINAIADANVLKDTAITALNTEIQKLHGEIVKVEEILAIANTMTMTELETALETLECEYIAVTVEGLSSNKDAGSENVKFTITATVFGYEYDVLVMTATLKINPVILDVEISSQTIKTGEEIDQTMFTITSELNDAITTLAQDAIILVVNIDGEIIAQIKSGVTNFELGAVTVGTLTVEDGNDGDDNGNDGDDNGNDGDDNGNDGDDNGNDGDDNGNDGDDNGNDGDDNGNDGDDNGNDGDDNGNDGDDNGNDGDDNGNQPIIPDIQTDINENNVPLADADAATNEENNDTDGSDDSNVEIEDNEVPTSAAQGANLTWLWVALAGIATTGFIIFLIAKRRKDEEEEEDQTV